jgi:hypothetical protein
VKCLLGDWSLRAKMRCLRLTCVVMRQTVLWDKCFQCVAVGSIAELCGVAPEGTGLLTRRAEARVT